MDGGRSWGDARRILGKQAAGGEKVVTVTIPMIEKHAIQLGGFKGVANVYKLNIVQNLQFQFSGDPVQWSYEQVTNTLGWPTRRKKSRAYI